MSVDQIIENIIRREGGFVDHPHDRGGPTNFGITLPTLRRFRGVDVDRTDVERLTEEQATEIYRKLYVEDPRFDLIQDELVQEMVVDAGVHHGTGTAARWLQRAVGVDEDGKVGPVTLQAVNEAWQQDEMVRRFTAYRVQFMGQLITRDHTQAPFAHGWLKRATEFLV